MDQSAYPSPRSAWYVTILLTFAYSFSFIDRQVINLLVDPIKNDLGVSDIEFSYLQGMLFVAPYILMSVPVGRLVDRMRRFGVVAAGIVVWSIATMLSGLAGNYSQLAVARMAVGAGESSVTPAAWSLLADYFPREKLAFPVSIFLMAPYIGGGLALIAGAEVMTYAKSAGTPTLPFLGEIKAWQLTLLIVGAPGLILAALFTVLQDPPRKDLASASGDQPPMRDVFAYLGQNPRIYLALLGAVPFMVVMLYGLQAWTPSMFTRQFGWSLGEAGRFYGMTAIIAGSLGVVTGPVIGRLLLARGYRDYPLRLCITGAAGACAALVVSSLQSDGTAALICVAAASFFVTLPLALITNALQIVTPNEMRGTVAGFYVVTVNLIGMGVGPTAVAFIMQNVLQDQAAIAPAMAIMGLIVAPIAIFLFARAMHDYRERVNH